MRAPIANEFFFFGEIPRQIIDRFFDVFDFGHPSDRASIMRPPISLDLVERELPRAIRENVVILPLESALAMNDEQILEIGAPPASSQVCDEIVESTRERNAAAQRLIALSEHKPPEAITLPNPTFYPSKSIAQKTALFIAFLDCVFRFF